jgi:hypothetical protein
MLGEGNAFAEELAIFALDGLVMTVPNSKAFSLGKVNWSVYGCWVKEMHLLKSLQDLLWTDSLWLFPTQISFLRLNGNDLVVAQLSVVEVHYGE